MIAVQFFARGVGVVRAASADVKLSLGADPALPGASVLLVDYPAASGDPAARDVWCDVEQLDWSGARALAFEARPERDLRISISFLDANRVAYTAWAKLRGGEWQTVRIAFAEIRPNPFFQPPGAPQGVPLDVRRVERIGFAPQDPAAGRWRLARLVAD